MHPQREEQLKKYAELMKTYGKPLVITQGDEGAAVRMAARAFRAKLTVEEREVLRQNKQLPCAKVQP